MFLVLFNRITEYKYIVEIYMYEPSDKVSEDHCHKTLKCSGSVTVSLLHCMAHEGAIYSGECGLPHIAWFHAYLFIHVGHIDL